MNVQFEPNLIESTGNLSPWWRACKDLQDKDLRCVLISPTGNVYGPFSNHEKASEWAKSKQIKGIVEILLPPT